MKKFNLLLLSTIMVFALAGCGTSKTSTTTDDVQITDTTTTTDEAQTDTATTTDEAQTDTAITTDEEAPETSTGSEATTLGNKLADLFLTSIENSADIEAIANDLANASDMNCVVVPAVEGYLNGFSEEISGFTSGVQFSPMIGSIPFVGYIFETDDVDGLMNKLTSVADPRWNICTEAAETVCVSSGSYVFFTMCPDENE